MTGYALMLAGAVMAVGAAVYGLPLVERLREVQRLSRRCRATRTLVLTFDDGPGPDLTPRLLTELERFGGKATFFALGRRAERAPQVLDSVASAGHEIGVHSYEHRNAWRVGPWKALEDTRRGFESLARWAPGPGAWYRPPNGKLDLLTRLSLWRRKARVGWWTIDGGDTWSELPTVSDIADRVMERQGGVVLLHDFDREDGERNRFVLELTRELLSRAEDAGMRVLPLGQLLRADEPGRAQ